MSLSRISIASVLATWFYVGKTPFAPGTFGTLAALPFAYPIQYYTGSFGLFIASIIACFVGSWAAANYMKNGFLEHDPGEIVIDEVAGVWLLLSALPFSLNSYIIGFLVFRVFDILKPWPVSFLDRKVKGGMGVMLDDITAGVYPVFFLALFTLYCRSNGQTDMLESLYTLLEKNPF